MEVPFSLQQGTLSGLEYEGQNSYWLVPLSVEKYDNKCNYAPHFNQASTTRDHALFHLFALQHDLIVILQAALKRRRRPRVFTRYEVQPEPRVIREQEKIATENHLPVHFSPHELQKVVNSKNVRRHT